MTKVSVIVSTYNRGSDFLPLALASILKQDYTDYEVIVADDASTDCTPDVLKTYSRKFTKKGVPFTAFRLEKNSGYQCIPKNMAIYVATGDYIAYLDDDNEWMPDHLSTMMKEFDDKLELDLVYCWRKYIGDGKSIDVDPHPPNWNLSSRSIMAGINCIDTSDIIHSRGLAYMVYDKYNDIWDENERRFGDLTLLSRMIMVGARGKLVPKELTKYRWHDNNL